MEDDEEGDSLWCCIWMHESLMFRCSCKMGLDRQVDVLNECRVCAPSVCAECVHLLRQLYRGETSAPPRRAQCSLCQYTRERWGTIIAVVMRGMCMSKLGELAIGQEDTSSLACLRLGSMHSPTTPPATWHDEANLSCRRIKLFSDIRRRSRAKRS